MNKSFVSKLLLIIGICPFVLPFALSFTKMSSWTLADWLIMYSFVYWPTYIAGFVLTAFAVYRLIKKN